MSDPNTVPSPNMNMPVPAVGQDPGPNYAENINISLGILDQHTHAPGSGVLITPNAININAALTFNNQSGIDIAGLTLLAQGSVPNPGTIYRSGVDLYYVDGNNNNIAITNLGSIAGANGSIANLNPPASATYVALDSTFVFQSGTGIAANLDAASILLRNISPNSTFSLTLNPPAAMGTNSTITLPSVPTISQQSFMTIDQTGLIAAPIPFSQGITNSNIANATITGAKLVDHTLDQTQIAEDFRQFRRTIFPSDGTFTADAGTSSSTVYKITVIGGGGSGASTGGASSFGGGGGGGGGTAITWITGVDVPPSTSVAVTIGPGGVSAGSGNILGNSGGTSSFGTFAIASGGTGGGNTTANALGGAGGVGTTGDILLAGSAGAGGYGIPSFSNNGGEGGSSSLGGGGRGGHGAVAASTGGTGGGGGGSNVAATGAGGPGLVIVEWLQ